MAVVATRWGAIWHKGGAWKRDNLHHIDRSLWQLTKKQRKNFSKILYDIENLFSFLLPEALCSNIRQSARDTIIVVAGEYVRAQNALRKALPASRKNPISPRPQPYYGRGPNTISICFTMPTAGQSKRLWYQCQSMIVTMPGPPILSSRQGRTGSFLPDREKVTRDYYWSTSTATVLGIYQLETFATNKIMPHDVTLPHVANDLVFQQRVRCLPNNELKAPWPDSIPNKLLKYLINDQKGCIRNNFVIMYYITPV